MQEEPLELWADDRHDPLLAAHVTEDEHAADTAHLYDTPSFLIGRTASAPIRSLGQTSTVKEISGAVEQALNSSSNRGHISPRHESNRHLASFLQPKSNHRQPQGE